VKFFKRIYFTLLFKILRRTYTRKVAKDLCSVQPMPAGPMKALFKWFEDNPGMGFYFARRKEKKDDS